jgi:hypothetical protein
MTTRRGDIPREDCEPEDDNGGDGDNGLDDYCCCLNHIPEANLCCVTYMDCPFNLPKGKYGAIAMIMCAVPLLAYCLCHKCCSTSEEGGEKSEDSPPYQEME